MRAIAFVSHKGGVGKSTLTALLAWKLEGEGQKVLAIDFDPQGSLTFLLSENYDAFPEEATTLRLFRGQPVKPFPITERFALLGAAMELIRVERHPTPSQLALPAQTLPSLPFSLCLLDTPTGIHRPLTVAALLAADAFIIPVDPSPLSLAGLVSFLNGLEGLRERYGKDPRFLGAILNMAESHTLVTQRIHRLLNRLLGEGRVLGVIPKRTKLRELGLTRRFPNDPAVLEGVEGVVKALLRGGDADGSS